MIRTLVLPLALTACTGASTDLFMVHVTTDPDPAVSGEVVTIMMHVLDSETEEHVADASLEVVPWMPAHGHGVEHDVDVMPMEAMGHYMADVTFTMPGAWELQIHVDDGDVEDDVVVPIEVE